jgi:hypothetical protein
MFSRRVLNGAAASLYRETESKADSRHAGVDRTRGNAAGRSCRSAAPQPVQKALREPEFGDDPATGRQQSIFCT